MFLVDFAEAYDSVQHGFFAAVLRFFAMPEAYVQMLSSALRGAVLFCTDSRYMQDVSMTPRSGIRQGDPFPLSLAIFALLTVFLVYQMGQDCLEVEMLLNADDLLISFQGTGQHLVATARKVMAVLAKLGYFSGLNVN